jgi:hypothetical protein
MIGVVEINNWRDAASIGNSLIRWAFRGQSNKSWTLKSSIERITERNGGELDNLHNREFWILRQFQRRAHILINSPPSTENSIEWLSIIQHFGGPTRLLDFTHSFYIAAFFAMEQANSDSAFWAIDLGRIEEKNGSREEDETIDHSNRRFIKIAERSIERDDSKLWVINVEPDRLNERMAIQKGLFLFPKKISSSFMDNLAATFNHSAGKFSKEVEIKTRKGEIKRNIYSNRFPPVLKIILPKGIHARALDDLDEMNINAGTLFPGLEGFARSLAQHLRYA